MSDDSSSPAKQEPQTYEEALNNPWLSEDQKSRILADAVIGHAAAVLTQRGDRKTAALLLDIVDAYVGYDPEDGTSNNLWIDLSPEVFPAFTTDIVERLKTICVEVAERRGYPVGWVGIRETLPHVGPGWQQQLREQMGSRRPTNHARKVRLESPAFTEDHLSFTNAGELAVYRALKDLQTTALPTEKTIGIYPLAGGRIPGRTWEPDVLVTYNGRAGVIEIDGPHHRGRRAMDTTRDHLLRDAGIAFVDRIPVEVLDDPAELKTTLQRFLRRLGETK